MRPVARKIITYYEVADGSERDLTLTVEPEDARHASVVDDLDELGVPESEQRGVRERAIEAYWAAERQAYLRSPQAERDGA